MSGVTQSERRQVSLVSSFHNWWSRPRVRTAVRNAECSLRHCHVSLRVNICFYHFLCSFIKNTYLLAKPGWLRGSVVVGSQGVTKVIALGSSVGGVKPGFQVSFSPPSFPSSCQEWRGVATGFRMWRTETFTQTHTHTPTPTHKHTHTH